MHMHIGGDQFQITNYAKQTYAFLLLIKKNVMYYVHRTKSRKASLIDTTVKAFQRTVFFDH
jgi:hypothetical protein